MKRIGIVLFFAHCSLVSTTVGPFDVLYPTTYFNKAVSMSMQIRSFLSQFRTDKKENADYAVMFDILAGRVSLLKNSIERVLVDKNITNDAIEYLLTIIECMESETKQMISLYNMNDYSAIIRTIKSITASLELCLTHYV